MIIEYCVANYCNQKKHLNPNPVSNNMINYGYAIK